MGCSPTKDQHQAGNNDADYMQPDIDLDAYHFHQFVRDLITIDEGVQKFLNILYMEWPIPNPKNFKTLRRYGQTYETWPQNHQDLIDTIDRTEHRLCDSILGDKLRPVAAYLKGAATMKELLHASEACSDEIAWPDVQYIFREMLPQIKNKNHKPLLNHEDVLMLDPKISLRYRVGKARLAGILEGEWRVYHQKAGCAKGGAVEECSYGIMIHNVCQVGAEATKGGALVQMKGSNQFTFDGHSRLGDKYTISEGKCFWNEFGNHGVRMTWTENWTDGTTVANKARLKVNGKFECLGLAGSEVKKGSREDNFSVDPHERLKLKYYHGDREAAFEDCIPFADICQENFDEPQMEVMMREIFMAWPTVDSPDDYYSENGDKRPKKIDRGGKHIKTWPLDKDAFVAVVESCSASCELVAKALSKEMILHTEATEECLTWPDLQEAFRRAGHGCGDIARNKMCHHKVRLTLKVPEDLIKEVLEGEWRMFCKGDGITNKKAAFSYGMYITNVAEIDPPNTSLSKTFCFQGRSRVEGKWIVQNGKAFWNEEHTGRVRLEYTEQWAGKGGTCDQISAHLKVNLKFECMSTCGFIQKARRECTLPDESLVEERLANKYYIGDRDAAYEIDPHTVCQFSDWIGEQGAAGATEFLTHLFFHWPTLPNQPETVHRYGHKRETWPLTADTVVSAITADGKYEQKVADGMLTHLYDKNECESCKGETIMWPDFQVMFAHALGDAAKDVHMLDKDHRERYTVNLTLKIPENQISDCMRGEYRMYCENVETKHAFSYGLIVETVTESSSEPNGFGTNKKTFTFTGRPRQDGKYVMDRGAAVWNEAGTGRLFLEYAEHWPDGMVDNLKARLKSNGKFACESTVGFVQKARKESTLPTDVDERAASKYYIGDQDAIMD